MFYFESVYFINGIHLVFLHFAIDPLQLLHHIGQLLHLILLLFVILNSFQSLLFWLLHVCYSVFVLLSQLCYFIVVVLLDPLQLPMHILHLDQMHLSQVVHLGTCLVYTVLQLYRVVVLHLRHLFQLGLLSFADFHQHRIFFFVVLEEHLSCLPVRRHLHLLHIDLLTIHTVLVQVYRPDKSLVHLIFIYY